MTLVVFDLDGTLLNAQSKITPYTGETLKLLERAGVAYTIATGRTLQGARGPIDTHRFALPISSKMVPLFGAQTKRITAIGIC